VIVVIKLVVLRRSKAPVPIPGTLPRATLPLTRVLTLRRFRFGSDLPYQMALTATYTLARSGASRY